MYTIFAIMDYAICSRCGYARLGVDIVSNILTIIYALFRTRSAYGSITYLLTRSQFW